jgi:hypothetical protein
VKLYQYSKGHGGLACESCHGSTHAEWPARVSGNDNVTPVGIQGHTGPIIECVACHGQGLLPTMKGPHGLHNVNARHWNTGHATFSLVNQIRCQACHGLTLGGTAIARTAADRVLTRMGGTKISIAKGTPVHCGLCHVKPLPRTR